MDRRNKQIYGDKSIYLATKLTFGKYKDKDKSIYQIIKEDIDYADWLINTAFKDKNIDSRVIRMFNEYWEQRNMKRYGLRNDNLNR